MTIKEKIIIEMALESLMTRYQRTKKVIDPRDKEATKAIFQILRYNKIEYISEEIESWLIERDWEPKYAADVKKIADSILKKKKLDKETKPWKPDIFETWTEKADERLKIN